jgi:DNA-binding response OmpR family regulator
MCTVLFVEDQIELRAIHSTYLQRQGFHVITADDGESAIEMARAHRPDIIVLDQSLPGRTGVEVARELQSDREMAGIPILMLTALAYGAIGHKAREAGCVGFLSKPCLPSRLLEEVRRLTRQPALTQRNSSR